MLAANECVATWLEDLGVPRSIASTRSPSAPCCSFEELARPSAIHSTRRATGETRCHARDRRDPSAAPQPRSYEVRKTPVTPRMYQKLAAKIEGKPEERILSYLMLRSLRQARYSEINEATSRWPHPVHALHLAHPPLS